ncbi:hypothetical protein [Lysinibacillus sp. NPDC059133]|uniref:hypothetical protein n=1 Tax=Lysinibacillus sp. NPDC059133 TaxID=3346737 RepID=UPI0036CEF1DD
MKNRSKAYIRHQRERIIRKKWAILKDVKLRESDFMPVRGRLSKGKVHCSCRMCRYEQFHSIPKTKHKAKLKTMEQEIDEYVYFLFHVAILSFYTQIVQLLPCVTFFIVYI